MADREKIMQWLKTCANGCEDGCPYEYKNLVYRVECKADLMRDALTLLKAQEPRVLTLEEAKKAEVCWLEERGYEPFATLEAGTWNPEKYGKSYRCWNHMPTEEQRKAVKWE